MDAEWYYVVNSEQHGPVTLEALKELVRTKVLKPLDLVWHQPFGSEWKTARNVPELTPTFAACEADAVPINNTAMPPIGNVASAAGPAPFSMKMPVRQTAPAADSAGPGSAGTFEGAPAEGQPRPPQMSGVRGGNPSAFAAVSDAWRRTVDVLFRGFSLSRWFSIGFCVWLSLMGGGGGSSIPRPGTKMSAANPDQQLVSFKNSVDNVLQWVWNNLPTAKWMTLGGIVLVLILLFVFLFCWLRSRGDLMFMHKLYVPDENIGACWRFSEANGWSLFVWRVGFAMVNIAVWGALAMTAWRHILTPYMRTGMTWTPEFLLVPAVAICGGCILWALVMAGVEELMEDFVVPVMYWQGVSANRAWAAALSLCNQHPFGIIGFYFVKGLCGLAAGLCIFLLVLGTCCIALIPLMLPYLGTVVMLPWFYFRRGYSANYLAQWRPDLVPDR